MREKPSPLVIYGPTICLENTLLEAGQYGLFCDNGKIQQIAPLASLRKELPSEVSYVEFPEDAFLLPGMIDLHIHGSMGFDVMDATPEALAGISQALLRQGTTGFLATTMTESPEKIKKALKNISHCTAENPLREHLLGIHLEGPFLAKPRMGAQCGEHIVAPHSALFDEFYAAAEGKIKVVTLAVESPGSLEFIRHLVKKGVVVSIGHTDATFGEAQQAIDAGATYATHLFNAMRGIHHREPGCACAILMDERVTAELIADGVHLHPDMVKFALHVKGLNRVVLVTDAMRAQCLGNGEFDLGGQSVTVQGKEARLQNGTLAGSVLTLKEALFNAKSFAGLDWLDASRLTSANPAKVAGCFHERGSLEAQKRADFIVMNPDGTLEATFFGGCRVN